MNILIIEIILFLVGRQIINTVESDHKAMIVISHPWEFVPKGSSHLNYHTNSSTTTIATATANNQQQKSNTTTTTTTTTAAGGGGGTTSNQAMQEPTHLQQKIGPKKNVRVMINSEFNNSSLNDMSYAYWQKSPGVINKLNFEQPVIFIFNILY